MERVEKGVVGMNELPIGMPPMQQEAKSTRRLQEIVEAVQRLARVVAEHHGEELRSGDLLEAIEFIAERIPEDARLRTACLAAAAAWDAVADAEEAGEPASELYRAAREASEARRQLIDELRDAARKNGG